MEIIKFTPQIYAVKGTRIPSEAAKAVEENAKKACLKLKSTTLNRLMWAIMARMNLDCGLAVRMAR